MYILEKIKNKLRWQLQKLSSNIINSAVDAALFELGYEDFSSIRIVDSFQTIAGLLEGHRSFGRYGDGEFNIIFGKDIEFQKYSNELSERLLSILKTKEKDFYVGVPKFYFYPDNRLRLPQRYFLRGWVRENRAEIASLLSRDVLYYDTCATQLYAIREDENLKSYFNLMRKIWHGNRILVVCGENSFKKVSTDLVNNSLEVSFIRGPSRNAFESYSELLAQVLQYSKDTVVLISLGPTATVMAYDLHKLGYKAIDIGHAFKDYQMFTKKETMNIDSIAEYYKAD